VLKSKILLIKDNNIYYLIDSNQIKCLFSKYLVKKSDPESKKTSHHLPSQCIFATWRAFAYSSEASGRVNYSTPKSLALSLSLSLATILLRSISSHNSRFSALSVLRFSMAATTIAFTAAGAPAKLSRFSRLHLCPPLSASLRLPRRFTTSFVSSGKSGFLISLFSNLFESPLFVN